MPKKPISATIDEDLISWIDEKIKDETSFRNKSHLIEIALEKLRKEGR
ncbi:ribbon-helix-helix domain-containing protein [Candidatus Woesearchaeota archaeon]|nr:ribbon-helix-helix domain-containing protein [Candidatus Woesearchaeota archaeon]